MFTLNMLRMSLELAKKILRTKLGHQIFEHFLYMRGRFQLKALICGEEDDFSTM